jgi:hypothetical protein
VGFVGTLLGAGWECRWPTHPAVGTKPSFQRGHSESFVSPPRKGTVTKRYKSGSFALSLVACPDFRFLLCAKTRQINQGRGMALRVFNYSQVMFMYITVNLQRFTQGEIDNFHVCVRVVVGDAILEVLNNDVIFAGNRRIKDTLLEILHLLMQNSPCSVLR